MNSKTIPEIKNELTAEQQEAFDALNTLQLYADKKNRIYSTFPDIEHPCYPEDSVFVLSKQEMHSVLLSFVEENCKKMDANLRVELAGEAALAQEEYEVRHCYGDGKKDDGMRNGKWVLPGILGRRDLVIVW